MPMIDYAVLAASLLDHGVNVQGRDDAKRMVFTAAYSGVLSARETFVVGEWLRAVTAQSTAH